MNKPLQHLEDHPSYQNHRKQIWTQILLPILIAILIFIAFIIFIVSATFRSHGDVSRWAAISTIWLTLPVILASLILLIVLGAMIYLLTRLTGLIPPYSYQAQRIVYRVEGAVRKYALMFRKPVLALQELTKLVRTYIENYRKTNSV